MNVFWKKRMKKRSRLLLAVLLLVGTALHLGARATTALPAIIGGGLAVGFYSKSREAGNEAETIKVASEARGQDYLRSKKYQSACRRKRLFQVLAVLSLAGGFGGSALMRRSDTPVGNEIVPKREATAPNQPGDNLTPKDTAVRKKQNAKALSKAIIGNDATLVATLAKKAGKTELMLKNEDGNTPLMEASLRGNPSIVQTLAAIVGEDGVNQQNEVGNTALMLAIERGHVEVVRALVPLSDPEALRTTVNGFGRTPLAIATDRGDDAGTEMAHIISSALRLPNDIPGETPAPGTESAGASEDTEQALRVAIAAQDFEAIKRLDREQVKNALITIDNNYGGKEPIFSYNVLKWGDLDVLRYLIDIGGKEIINAEDWTGSTALLKAATLDNVEAVQILAPLAEPDTITDRFAGMGSFPPLAWAKFKISQASASKDTKKAQQKILAILEDELERKTGKRNGGLSETGFGWIK